MSQKRKRFLARVLDSDTIRKIAPSTWIQWRKTPDYYRGVGYKQGQEPPITGDLLVQSPYADWYNLTWGLAPNQDQPKWRWMYRARPEVRRGIDTKTILAVGRGFRVVVENNEEIEEFVNNLLYKINVRDILQGGSADMLGYGTGYFEKIRVVEGDKQEAEVEPIQQLSVKAEVTRTWTSESLDKPDKDTLKNWISDSDKVDRWLAERAVAPDTEQVRATKVQNGDGDLVELKPLDPLWMRVNRDAFGNIIGYVQWGLTPIPISILPEKLVVLKWMPRSWAHENAYGTSILMPVQRHVSLLVQAEEDMKIWIHQYAKPTNVIYGGLPDKPEPVPKLQALATAMANRQPNSDLILPGNYKLEVVKGGMSDTTPAFDKWMQYLREKIYETLGIPSILMNMPGQTVRATSDVSLQAFIAEEEMIQEIIGEQFMKQVIEPEVRKQFGEVPQMKIIWPPVLEEDRNRKMDRIIKAVGRPFMSVNEGRSEAGLTPRPESKYDEIPEKAEAGFGQTSKGPEYSESQRTGSREEGLSKQDSDVPSANE